MIDFKWENGVCFRVEDESEFNVVVESMGQSGFDFFSDTSYSKLSEHGDFWLELYDNRITVCFMEEELEEDSVEVFYEDVIKTPSTPTGRILPLVTELSPPYWNGEGIPEVGMILTVENTRNYPMEFIEGCELRYLSDDYCVIYQEGCIGEYSFDRDVVVLHKCVPEQNTYDKLQAWCGENQRALGMDHLLQQMVEQGLINEGKL